LVILPTLPPYRSDTSINFFLGEKDKHPSKKGAGKIITPPRGRGKKGVSPTLRAAGLIPIPCKGWSVTLPLKGGGRDKI